MTTPHQRTRATLQTRSFLARLETWPGVPREVQDEARRLLYHYPEAQHLVRANQSVPDDWGSVEGVLAEAAGRGPIVAEPVPVEELQASFEAVLKRWSV